MRMGVVRTWLPAAIVVAGLVVVVATNASETGIEGGALLIAAGLSVWLLNWLFRLGVAGDREREREDRAREYFDVHGRWPDEPPPARSTGAGGHAGPREPLDSPHGRRRRR